MEKEVVARERSAAAKPVKRPSEKPPSTAFALVTGIPGQVSCVYCNQSHVAESCPTVKSVGDRRQILRTTGRCFVCLKRRHVSRDCHSSTRCSKCNGRHHTSLCFNGRAPAGNATSTVQSTQQRHTQQPGDSTTLYVNTHATILLQTAKVVVKNGDSLAHEARAILDLGSQRSYVTASLRQTLKLKVIRSEALVIKGFGSERAVSSQCDIVEVRIAIRAGGYMKLLAVVVPHICDPVHAQPITFAKSNYQHLANLELADPGEHSGELNIDILVGSDHYWDVVTGRVIRGPDGPVATDTRFGWVLSGPIQGTFQDTTTLTVVSTGSTHLLRIGAQVEQNSLNKELKRFWEIESLGILKEEPTVKEVHPTNHLQARKV